MKAASKAELILALEQATQELDSLARSTEKEVRAVAAAFEDLSGYADTILNLAGAIVASVEGENVSTVLPRVRNLGMQARSFVGERLEATNGILETVTSEVKLLRQLSLVTRGQRAIALQTQALSVLANMEAARLGAIGVGFQQLARELSSFSKSLNEDTQALSDRTDGRRNLIEDKSGALADELPLLREKMSNTEAVLGRDLAVLDANLTQLSSVPLQFRKWVEEIAQQVTGVVAAVQAHDITRQQIEHVQEAFGIISAGLDGNARGDGVALEMSRAMSRAYAGLTIQIYQLRTIKETVASWTAQIRTCMEGILKISASQVVGIGPMVLKQEREVSSQLAHIEMLERESQAYSEKIQHTFGGLASLMQLVGEHLQKSKAVRNCLQLLTFNSIIEATHIGVQARAILAIARSIEGISSEWGDLSDQSARAMGEIQELTEQTNRLMSVFSAASEMGLREAQLQTRTSLEGLRATAVFAANKAQAMKLATDHMQAGIAKVEDTGQAARCMPRPAGSGDRPNRMDTGPMRAGKSRGKEQLRRE